MACSMGTNLSKSNKIYDNIALQLAAAYRVAKISRNKNVLRLLCRHKKIMESCDIETGDWSL